ncbi:MAG: copper chaperone PCu(A)C [Alphaproteobacteria bacterium]|nr:copper chaperone PCu(A)C [Alphaproteobacteria bacterium]
MRKWWTIVLLPMVIGLGTNAAEVRQGNLVIIDAWARSTPGPVRTGAAYLVLRNDGKSADRLIAVATPRADRSELHSTHGSGDIFRMRRENVIALPAGRSTELKPGGSHVMLTGLKEPLRTGETFPLTLRFASGGSIEVLVDVR